MDNEYIIGRMQGYIHKAAQELSSWLSKLLPQTSEDWWNDCVLDKLSQAQSERAREKGLSKLEELDLAALLRIADKAWYEMRAVAYLPSKLPMRRRFATPLSMKHPTGLSSTI